MIELSGSSVGSKQAAVNRQVAGSIPAPTAGRKETGGDREAYNFGIRGWFNSNTPD